MHSVATLFISLLALHLSLEASAGPHASAIRYVHRRHHARASALDLTRRETGCDDDGPSSTPSIVSAASPSVFTILVPVTNSTIFNSTQTFTNLTSSDSNDDDDGYDCNEDGSNTVAFNTSSTESLALPSPTSTGNFMNSTTYNITNSFTNATDSDDDGDYDCGDDGSDDTTLSITSTVSTVSVISEAYSASFATASVTSLGGQLFAGQNGTSAYSPSSASRSFTRSSAIPTTTTGINITSVISGSPLNSSVSIANGSNAIPSAASASASTTKHRKGHGSTTASATTASATSFSALASLTVTANITSPSATSSGSSGSFVAPHYVIYADNWLDSMIPAETVGSFNRFILAFWMSSEGPVDDAQAWQQFSASTRQSVLEEYHDAGIALMVSAFGSTDSPTSNGADPTSTAQELAQFVKDYGLDGVDVDYEDMTAMNNDQAESWLITFQTVLREQLPSPYIISHAPVAPWFTSANDYASGAYVKVHQAVGHTIDFYNIQFYNQGSDAYVDCTTLITDSGGEWPSTSVMEINSYAGVPLEKIVIGKPLDPGAADNGYMDPSTLNQCVAQAQALGWNAGVMFWEWTSEAPSMIGTVLG
ncbi:MAG: hypothetical protein TREMPRED_005496 [Tremellales sp. Tagirdzhanova-0007]|nr:MAG: hypothetical protein TREMPRED_005496 [Tremellales sp. Tagirdzhanova-0007]